METLHERLADYSVLVAEDDPSTLKWLVRILEIYFKKVHGAADALEAMELFQRDGADIVIADIQMPDVDGLSFLQKIASLAPATLRITMTAFNSHAYLNRALDAGVHFYLKKPIDIDELLVAVAANLPAPEATQKGNMASLAGGARYDLQQHILYDEKGSFVRLTRKERDILELLIHNHRGVVSVEKIEASVWEEPVTVDAIRMVVAGLRKKLPQGTIETHKGLGYRIILA